MSKWTLQWTGFKPRIFWIKMGDKYYGFGKPQRKETLNNDTN